MIIKGFMDQTSVILSINKLKCLDFSNNEYKEIDISNFDLKPFQIINIKGFKSFLRNKDILEFKDISGSNTENLSFNGLTFKKESGENYNFIAVYLNDERIISLNEDFLKPIFREFKLNDINSLRIFLNKGYPAYFEININQGFLIAPCIREDD